MPTEKELLSQTGRADAIRKELSQPNPFRSDRYRDGAEHIMRTGRYIFVETEADRTLKRVTGGKITDENTINMSYGDPSRYPGLEPFPGVVRFIRRFMHFEKPSVWAKYEFGGDPLLIGQISSGTSDKDKGYIEVPEHIRSYPCPGVAGALFYLIPSFIFPPVGGRQPDNVVVPKWTYLSHMGVVSLWGGEVRCCNLQDDGQIDLDHFESMIDANTRAVMLATVGNPLGVAIKHDIYDDMLRIVHKKMEEHQHPIFVVADVIYEHFRRECNGVRLDPIQKALSIGLGDEHIDVPIVEVSSWSKMVATPGERLGYHRDMFTCYPELSQARFAAELADTQKAIQIIYDLSLCPVPTLLQKPLGKLYVAIKARQPCEETLVPVAAVLAALRELTQMKGQGDTHTQMPEAVAENNIRMLGLDPEVWFTTSAIAKRTRKLAKEELGGYKLDVATEGIESVGEKLLAAGLISVKEIEVEEEKVNEILLASAARYCGADIKVEKALLEGLSLAADKGMISSGREDELKQLLYGQIIGSLTTLSADSGTSRPRNIKELAEQCDLVGEPTGKGTVKFRFYKLQEGLEIPEIKVRESGELKLYRISEENEWIDFVKRFNRSIPEEKAHLRIPTEYSLYDKFKSGRRELVHKRIDDLVRGIDDMSKRGLGIRLHPMCYDEQGNLVPERINSFYALITIKAIENSPCQASRLIRLCGECGADKFLKTTPGKVFLPPEFEDEGNYIRVVTLLDSDDDSKVISSQQLNEMLRVLEKVLKYLNPTDGEDSDESNQFAFGFYR